MGMIQKASGWKRDTSFVTRLSETPHNLDMKQQIISFIQYFNKTQFSSVSEGLKHART